MLCLFSMAKDKIWHKSPLQLNSTAEIVRAITVFVFMQTPVVVWGENKGTLQRNSCVHWCGLVLSPESQQPASASSCVTTAWCDLGTGWKPTVQGLHLLD